MSFVIVQLPWKRDMDTQQTYKKVIRGENEQLLTVSASETMVGVWKATTTAFQEVQASS